MYELEGKGTKPGFILPCCKNLLQQKSLPELTERLVIIHLAISIPEDIIAAAV